MIYRYDLGLKKAFLGALSALAFPLLAETVLIDSMDTSQSAWGNGVSTREVVKQGDAALAWAPEEGPLFRGDVSCDLSTYHSLRLWMYARSATFAKIKISIPSGEGAFVTTFTVDWQGWNRMSLPEWRFRTDFDNREAAWTESRGLRFEQTMPGFEPTHLVLDALELSSEWPTIQISDHETLIDWMYRGGAGSHLWKPTDETLDQEEGSYGLSRFWSWGTIWMREDPASRDICAYERTFGTDIQDYSVLEIRAGNDDAGYLSVSLKIDGEWHHPVKYHPGTGRFDAIAMPLPPGGRRLDAVRLDISEPPNVVEGPANRQLKCNVHWILLRRPDSPRGDPAGGIAPIEPRPLSATVDEAGLPGGIYFSREELPQIRRLFTTGAAAALGERIRRRADRYCETEPETYVGKYYPGSNWIVSRVGMPSFDLADCAKSCALSHVLFGEKRHADLARRALLSLCRIQHWTEGPFARYPLGWGGHGNPFTESGVTYKAGLAFDWIYHVLSPDERREVHDAILRKGVWWTYDKLRSSPAILKMNQGVVFDSNIGCALIPLAALDPACETMRQQTAKWIWQGIDDYSLQDGASTEGVGYWNYTWNTAVKLLAALGARDPEEFRARFPDNARRSLDWIVHMKSNAEQGFVPVAICDSRGAMPSSAVSALFATYLQHPTGAWFQAKHGGPQSDLAAFMWENDTEAVPPEMVLARHFRGAGYVFFREGFDYGDVLFGLLGQPRLAGHWQHDRSAFMLEAFGEYLAMDPGMMAYSNPIHRSMADTRLHNAITIDGQNNIHADAEVTGFFSSSVLDYAGVDAAAAYPEAEKMLRDALFIRPDHVVISDAVGLKSAGRIEWNLNSVGKLSLHQNRLVATAERSTLLADLFTDGDLQLETEEWPCGYPGITNHHGTLHVGKKETTRRFLVSLYPVQRGDETSFAADGISAENGDGLILRRGTVTETILRRLQPGTCKAGSCTTDADYAFVRTVEDHPSAAAMIRGQHLLWQGEPLLQASSPVNAAWDDRGDWLAVALQGDPGTTVRVPSPNADVRHALLGSVAGKWQPFASIPVQDGNLEVIIPAQEAPQGGWWMIVGTSPEQLHAALERPQVAWQEMMVAGEAMTDNAVFSAGEVPERVTLRIRTEGATVPPENWRVRIDGQSPGEQLYDVTPLPDGSVAVDLAVGEWLSEEGRRPRFFVTHLIEVSARGADLYRTRLSAGFRLSIKPHIESDALFLSDLTPLKAFVHGGIKADRPYSGDRIRLAGAEFPKGITTHPKATGGDAYAEVVYDLTRLPENVSRFVATVGVQQGSSGSVEFLAYLRTDDADWQQVFSSETITQTSDPEHVTVPLGEADQLRLLVTDGGDGIGSDHAVWAMARFE